MSRTRNEPTGVTARLRKLADAHSPAEIARRTGTPTTCVHRYLHGSKVPVDFCERVVREFQVNPSWLMLGEGAEDLSAIAERTGAMAGELLELVKAMNAVAHQRLGALAGKHHARVLRELNDALLRYDMLRQKIGTDAVRIYEDLRKQLQAAMAKLDVARAEELFKAADQVMRLCFDEKVEREHQSLKTNWALLRRDFDAVLKNQQHLFRNPLSEGHFETDEHCVESIRLAMSLENRGRLPDAERVARAGMVLAEGGADSLPSYPMLACLCGHYQILLGALHEGLPKLQRWAGRVSGDSRRASVRHMLMMGNLYSGAIEPGYAFDWGEHFEIKALDLLQAALVLEEPTLLEEAINYYQDRRVEHLEVYAHRAYLHVYARAVLAALRREPAAVESALRDLRTDTPEEVRGIYAEQLQQLGHAPRRRARRTVTTSSMPLLMTCRAYLNTLRDPKSGPSLREQAQAFFRRYEAGGFELFRRARERVNAQV